MGRPSGCNFWRDPTDGPDANPHNYPRKNPSLPNRPTMAQQHHKKEVPGLHSTLYNAISSAYLYITYNLVLWLMDAVIHTFFREVRLRGAFNIPKKGAVIFVCGPHHNQFVDPVILMSTAKKSSGRHISLLTAAKSFRTWYVGIPARLCSAIPVERAQDLVKKHQGTIWVDNFGPENDNLVVLGKGTRFLHDACVKGLVGLTDYLGNAKIKSIESDTKLILLTPFKVNFKLPSSKDQQVIERLTNGCEYVLADHIDSSRTFELVFAHLNKGKALGIFPEGGLHDRPTLLPLKPGVAIMALGAVAESDDPNQTVSIVPVGLNYFHPNRFRSRVVIEYGKPIVVTKADGETYEKDNRETVNKLLDLITLRLKEVTQGCEDYDTLIAIQAARRLYLGNARDQIPLPMVVEINRRLIRGYQKYSDRPDVRLLKDAVGEYNKRLMQLGLHDHQVESITKKGRSAVFITFFLRLFKVFLFIGLATPGIFMFSPIFIVASRISKQKAKKALAASVVKIKAKDVISTWKILVALGLAPIIYSFWALLGTYLLVRADLVGPVPKTVVFVVFYLWSVLTTYASLRVGEIGVDYYKSLPPLFYSLLLDQKNELQIMQLKKRRRELAEQVTEFCQRYGPSMFDDFSEIKKKYSKNPKVDEPEVQSDNPSKDGLGILKLPYLGDIAIFSNTNDAETSEEETDHSIPESEIQEPPIEDLDDQKLRQRRKHVEEPLY